MPMSRRPDYAPVLRLVPQRNESDCAIATLSSLTGISYEEVLIAAARVAPCETGMYMTQIQHVASELGVELLLKRKGRYDPETATGILSVSNAKASIWHVAILRQGSIIETDNSIWDWDVYLASKRLRAGSLLVMEDA
jgi:hypothetical protein